MVLRGAIVSIHDVTPETLPRIGDIVHFLKTHGVHRLTLLIIPGKSWTADQLTRLRTWQNEGVDLAGHGWRHRVHRTATIWHRLHGKLISRDAAEHLSLTEDEIAGVIRRCYRWFERSRLLPPLLYVPPAWAMGNISLGRLNDLPFRLYETQWGIYDRERATLYRMPVTGYMADTPVRSFVLSVLNVVNVHLPVRVTRMAVHPNDLALPLAGDLGRHLARRGPFLRYSDIVDYVGCRQNDRICPRDSSIRPPVRSRELSSKG